MAEGISRIGIISLVSAADTAAPLAPPGLGLRREPSGTLGTGGDAGQGTRRSGLTAVALELAATSYAAPLTSLEATNQKLLLLAALLQVRQLQCSLGRTMVACRVCQLQTGYCSGEGAEHAVAHHPPMQIGDWEHAQQLMRWLRALGLSDFAVFPAVGRALCECWGCTGRQRVWSVGACAVSSPRQLPASRSPCQPWYNMAH